jgi:hypothetical protein
MPVFYLYTWNLTWKLEVMPSFSTSYLQPLRLMEREGPENQRASTVTSQEIDYGFLFDGGGT